MEKDKSVFPFNEYEYLLQHFINDNHLSFQQYLEIRQEYINQNPHLWVFTLSNAAFSNFSITYLIGARPKLSKPNKEKDKEYSGEYDLMLDTIKIEVKASRAVDANSKEPLYMKALSSNTKQQFLMNFQQLKPKCCDAFIWVAVFRDKILTWVMPSKDVLNHPLYSKGQHRGNHGNEGQLHIKDDNIRQFDKYLLNDGILEQIIRSAYKKNA